jgi:hypothetical protein
MRKEHEGEAEMTVVRGKGGPRAGYYAPPSSEAAKWLESLEVGEAILVPIGRYYPPRLEWFVLVKRTNAQHVFRPRDFGLSSEYRVRRSDGRTLGLGEYSHFPLYLRKVPEEKLAELKAAQRHSALVRKLSGTSWSRLPLERLERIFAIVDEEDS